MCTSDRFCCDRFWLLLLVARFGFRIFLAAWFVFFVFVFVFYKNAHIRFRLVTPFYLVVFRERTGGEILERGMLEAALEEAGIGNGGGGGYTVDE
jgi:hypothetical protein